MEFCEICGKAITNENSVKRGMGPVCWKKQKAWRDNLAKVGRQEIFEAARMEEVKSA